MPWYVLHSKPNKEELLYEQLRIREIDTYYPYLNVRPTNPRARKRIPYFPGYIFIKADIDTIGTTVLKWTPGAVGLVDFGGILATVPDEILERVKHQVEHINITSSVKPESFKAGDIVKIQSGPFVGYRAIFDSHISGQERVRVFLQMLWDRHVGIELGSEQIEKLEHLPPR